MDLPHPHLAFVLAERVGAPAGALVPVLVFEHQHAAGGRGRPVHVPPPAAAPAPGRTLRGLVLGDLRTSREKKDEKGGKITHMIT